MKRKFALAVLFVMLLDICKGQNTFIELLGDSIFSLGEAYSVKLCTDGSFITTGMVQLTGDNNFSLLLSRINPSGKKIWNQYYKGGTVWGQSVTQTIDNGFIVGGLYSYSGWAKQYFLKTDSAGKIQWSKFYDQSGGGTDDNVKAIRQLASDSGYIAVGSFDLNTGGLTRLDKNGNLLWSNYYSNVKSFSSLDETSDGGYIVVGTSSGFVTVIVKLSATGTVIWESTLPLPPIANYSATSTPCQVLLTPGGYVVAGSVADSLYAGFLAKYDLAGTLQWMKLYEGDAIFITGASKSTSNRFILCGESYNFSLGEYESIILETDSLGKLNWSKAYQTVSQNSQPSIVQTADSGFVEVGDTRNANPVKYLPSIYKVNGVGNGICSAKSTLIKVADLTVPATTTTVTMHANTTTPLKNAGVTGVAFNQLTNPCITTENMETAQRALTATVFPNPSAGHLHFLIESNALSLGRTQIKIYDVLGNSMHESIVQLPQFNIDLSTQPKGIYFYKIASAGAGIVNGKIIIE